MWGTFLGSHLKAMKRVRSNDEGTVEPEPVRARYDEAGALPVELTVETDLVDSDGESEASSGYETPDTDCGENKVTAPGAPARAVVCETPGSDIDRSAASTPLPLPLPPFSAVLVSPLGVSLEATASTPDACPIDILLSECPRTTESFSRDVLAVADAADKTMAKALPDHVAGLNTLRNCALALVDELGDLEDTHPEELQAAYDSNENAQVFFTKDQGMFVDDDANAHGAFVDALAGVCDKDWAPRELHAKVTAFVRAWANVVAL